MSSHLPERFGNLSLNRNYVYILFEVIRKEGPVARALGSVIRLLNKCDSASVEQYCKETLGYSNTVYKNAFNRDDRDVLESGVPWEELDITLLYKLLQHVCGLEPKGSDVWASPTDCLESSLTKLKNTRNHVAHGLGSVSSIGLISYLDNIIQLLKNVFVKVDNELGRTLSLESKAMEYEMQDFLKSHLPPSIAREYQQSYAEALKNLRTLTVNKGQKELRDLYNRAWVVPPFPWSYGTVCKAIDVDQVYTSLRLETSRKVGIEELLSVQPSSDCTSHVICLRGSAGSGKTCLCSYILYNWCQNPRLIEGMADVDFLFLIQCRFVSYATLSDHIKNELMPYIFGRYNNILPVLKKCKNIFVFDGFDEANPNAKNLFREALSWPPQTRVIVTTEPQFTSEVIDIVKSNLSTGDKKPLFIDLFGFEEAKQKEYILKLFSALVPDDFERNLKMNGFLTYLDGVEETIKNILQLPLALSLMVYLWLEDESKVHCICTVTSLYLEIVRLNLHRLAKRLQQGSSKNDDFLRDWCDRFLNELSKEAYNQHRKSQPYIDEKGVERIQEICSPEIDTTEVLSSLLRSEKPLTQIDSRKYWVFPHKAFQVVLAGYFVQNCYKIGEIHPGLETPDDIDILIHAIGLMHLQKPDPDYMNMKKVANLIRIISCRNDYKLLHISEAVLQETEGSSFGKELSKKVISCVVCPDMLCSGDEMLCSLIRLSLHDIYVQVPNKILLKVKDSYSTRVIPVLKKQNTHLDLEVIGGNDFEPGILKEWMKCNTIKLSSRMDCHRQIGELWFSQIKNKSEASIAVIVETSYATVKVRGEVQVPHIIFSDWEELMKFLTWIQKIGTCLQQWFFRFKGASLDCKNSHIIAPLLSWFPFRLPKILSLNSVCFDPHFIRIAQIVKEEQSSLKIKCLYFNRYDHLSGLQIVFDAIECNLELSISEDVGEQIRPLANMWAKNFTSHLGCGNTAYVVKINKSDDRVTISVIVSHLKECKIVSHLKECKKISLCASLYQEGSLSILEKCARIAVCEVEKVGINRGGQTVCNLMHLGSCCNAELLSFIKSWAPINGGMALSDEY